MPASSDQCKTAVDSLPQLQAFLGAITAPSESLPYIYFTIGGVQPDDESSSIGFLNIHLSPQAQTYAINIRTLGQSAFTTTGQNERSPKLIFESALIPKVCFDVRRACHALRTCYEVNINCVVDLQLLELPLRASSREYVSGLKKCVERDHPTMGFQYSILAVEYLPGLWQTYSPQLRRPSHSFWRDMVREAGKSRLSSLCGKLNSAKPMGEAREPLFDSGSIEDKRDIWNDQVLSAWSEEEDLDINDFWAKIAKIRQLGPHPVVQSSVLTLAAVI